MYDFENARETERVLEEGERVFKQKKLGVGEMRTNFKMLQRRCSC